MFSDHITLIHTLDLVADSVWLCRYLKNDIESNHNQKLGEKLSHLAKKLQINGLEEIHG